VATLGIRIMTLRQDMPRENAHSASGAAAAPSGRSGRLWGTYNDQARHRTASALA
jgi:hypothetical protein